MISERLFIKILSKFYNPDIVNYIFILRKELSFVSVKRDTNIVYNLYAIYIYILILALPLLNIYNPKNHSKIIGKRLG